MGVRAWSSDPGVAGARELSHGGGDGGRSSPTPQAGVVCCPAANPCPAPPPTLLTPSMSMAPGAGCREAHCTGELPHTSSTMPMAQEGACREACPLERPPPLLTYTLAADGGGRRLCTTTTSTPALPSQREGQRGVAAMGSSVVAADAVTLC